MLALVGTVIFVFSAALPMIYIRFIVPFSIRLIDVYSWLGSEPSMPEDGLEMEEAFSTVETGFFLAAILYPFTVVTGVVSALTSSKVSLFSGVMGLILWLGSISGIMTLKSTISQMAGPLGPISSGFIQIGYGVYVGILGSTVLLISHIFAVLEAKAGSRHVAEFDPVDVVDEI